MEKMPKQKVAKMLPFLWATLSFQKSLKWHPKVAKVVKDRFIWSPWPH
jgi:hypothetical protein